MSTDGQSIREQVWRAVDPTGENRSLINAAVHGGPDVPDFLRRIGVDVGELWGRLAGVGAEYRKTVEGIEAAVRVLGPRGWSVMTMDTQAVRDAVREVQAGREAEADDILQRTSGRAMGPGV